MVKVMAIAAIAAIASIDSIASIILGFLLLLLLLRSLKSIFGFLLSERTSKVSPVIFQSEVRCVSFQMLIKVSPSLMPKV